LNILITIKISHILFNQNVHIMIIPKIMTQDTNVLFEYFTLFENDFHFIYKLNSDQLVVNDLHLFIFACINT
jgi:hypothetical protein